MDTSCRAPTSQFAPARKFTSEPTADPNRPSVFCSTQHIVDRHEEIKRLACDALGKALEIGKALEGKRAECEASSKKGKSFKAWVEDQLPFTRRQAYRYLGIWMRFGMCDDAVTHSMDHRAAEKFLPKSVPGEAIEEAIDRAGNGEHINEKTAREIIAKHKPEPFDAAAPASHRRGASREREDAGRGGGDAGGGGVDRRQMGGHNRTVCGYVHPRLPREGPAQRTRAIAVRHIQGMTDVSRGTPRPSKPRVITRLGRVWHARHALDWLSIFLGKQGKTLWGLIPVTV